MTGIEGAPPRGLQDGQETGQDPGPGGLVLGEVLHDPVQPVDVQLALVQEEEDQEAGECLLVQHLLARELCLRGAEDAPAVQETTPVQDVRVVVVVVPSSGPAQVHHGDVAGWVHGVGQSVEDGNGMHHPRHATSSSFPSSAATSTS